MTDTLIEAVALAMSDQDKRMWGGMSSAMPKEWTVLAGAALKAIEESGTHLVVERDRADIQVDGSVTLIPIPRPIVRILRREADDARNGKMVVNGIDIDMAELLEDAATEIMRLRALVAARPKLEDGA